MNFIKSATNALEATTKTGPSLSRQTTEHLTHERINENPNVDNEFAKRTNNISESFKNASTSVSNDNEKDNENSSTGFLGKIEDTFGSLNIGKAKTHERNQSIDNTNYNNNNERSNNESDGFIGGSLQKLHSINETVDEKLSSFISKKPQSTNNNNDSSNLNDSSNNNESSEGFFKSTVNKAHGLNQNIENKVESAMGLIGIKPTSSVTHNTPTHQSSQYNDSSFVERSRDKLDMTSNQDENRGLLQSAKDVLTGKSNSNRNTNTNYDDADVEDNSTSFRPSNSSFAQGARNKLHNLEEEVENKFDSNRNNNSTQSTRSRDNDYDTTESESNTNRSSFIDNTKSSLNSFGRKIENEFEGLNTRKSNTTRKQSNEYENNENDYNSNNNKYNNNNNNNNNNYNNDY